MEGLTIDKINILQSDNDRLRKELESRNQMLMQAHFQNKKLSDELLITKNQYQMIWDNKQDYTFKIRLNEKNKLPFRAEEMGEWVGKVGTIDVIAEGEEKVLIAGCNWDKPMYTYDDLEWLLFCADKAAVEPDYVYLFSIERFDEKLALEAKIKRNLRLISAKEL